MVHAPLGAAFLGDGSPKGAPVVEIVDGGAEGDVRAAAHPVWAEMRDGFGVPSVRVLKVPPSGK